MRQHLIPLFASIALAGATFSPTVRAEVDGPLTRAARMYIRLATLAETCNYDRNLDKTLLNRFMVDLEAQSGRVYGKENFDEAVLEYFPDQIRQLRGVSVRMWCEAQQHYLQSQGMSQIYEQKPWRNPNQD